MTISDQYSDPNALYLDEELTFEKVGMEAHLSDNSDTWVQEVMQELMKQHPYLGQYDVMPEMTQVEGDKGYGFGYFTISNKTSTPPSQGGEALAAEAGVTTIRVPIIIKEKKLASFDVFLGEKPYPLSEERVRQAMFRPQLFDSTGLPPRPASMVDKLYPPGRQQAGSANRSSVSYPAMKLGAAKPYLMEAIGGTINQSDITRIENTLSNDMKVASALANNEATLPFMRYLATIDPVGANDVAKVASECIRPNVAMVYRSSDGYHLKTASSTAFSPEETIADRPTMSELAGPDMVREADSSGVSVVSTDPVVREIVEDSKVEKVDRFGEYRVKATDGKELLGWVFPTVLDFDGTQLPMSLFSNGSTAAMQDDIAGSFVGVGTNVIRGEPKGNGFFYRVTTDGSALAFVPGEIEHAMKDPNGFALSFKTVLGEQYKVRLVPGLKAITKIGDSEYAIPGDVQWLPFDGSALTKLMDDPELFSKTASAKQSSSLVKIISDGHTWSFTGGCGVTKLAAEETTGLEACDALFLSCALGMDEPTAMRALAMSGQRGSVKVAGCRTIKTAMEAIEESRERAKELWSALPSRPNLLKEASALEDATTVDKVLSIGFLNPENVATFIGYLPEIDRTISKLAELLVAIRLGLKDVPEIAVKNAMERLDEVATALKALMYRSSEPS